MMESISNYLKGVSQSREGGRGQGEGGGGAGKKLILKVNRENVSNFMIPKKSCTKLAMTRKQTQ